MNRKLLVNDFKKKPWKNLILLLFMCLSVMITVSVVLMLSQLFSSIHTMYETANPPHFLQMHKGELQADSLKEFNREYEGILHSQTVAMIDLYGGNLTITEGEKAFSLSNCRLDIGFVRQNQKYDVLLDENRKPLEIKRNEIGVPVILMDDYDIHIGDRLTLRTNGITKDFTVSAFVHDGMMNSTMCSSTRFLINDQDFEELLERVGETEYIVEVWFTDSSAASTYQTAYEQDTRNLPKNGQAVTYQMMFLLSALTDLMTAMVFVLGGILMIVIAVIGLRYVILAELSDDTSQIGTMKAIGIPETSIRELYLGKTRLLMLPASLIGILLSFCILPVFTEHIGRTFGNQHLSAKDCLLAFFAAACVYGLILLFARKLLHRIQKAGITDLLVRGKWPGKKKKTKDGLRRNTFLPTDLLMGLHEARHGYGIIFTLFLLVSVLMLLPLRTVQTMQQEDFVTSMGSPVCDLLAEVEQGDQLEKRREVLEQAINREVDAGSIKECAVLRRVRLNAKGSDGTFASIHVDTGSTAGKGIRYLDGTYPNGENELAFSVLLAEELGKSVGDSVTIPTGKKEQNFILCGIYQDVTSGGRTAKAICDFEAEPSEKYTFQIMLQPDINGETVANSLRQSTGTNCSIENMESFLSQTLGGVTGRIGQASKAVFAVGIFITACIILLFMELKIARTLPLLAEKKAIGIPLASIRLQELVPVLFVGEIGILCGIALSGFLGDDLVSSIFGLLGLGLKSIKFSPFTVSDVFVPLLLTVALVLFTLVSLSGIRKIQPGIHLDR